MTFKQNLRQLVLRRDTATGLLQVGLDVDLPPGRFQHIDVICELRGNDLPDPGTDCFEAYQQALSTALKANQQTLQQQSQQLREQGWQQVPFSLASSAIATTDNVGSSLSAAMQLLSELIQNQRHVWVVVHDNTIVHVRPRYPGKALDELSSHVWYHQQIQQLSRFKGTLLEGELHVYISGLWFKKAALA